MARAGCVYLGLWKSAASFSYPSGSGTGLESSRKAMPQNGADSVIHNPRAWTWLCSPEKLIAVTMEMPRFPLRSWD